MKVHDNTNIFCQSCHSKVKLKSQIKQRLKVEKLKDDEIKKNYNKINNYNQDPSKNDNSKYNDAKIILARIKANAMNNINKLNVKNKSNNNMDL